MGVKVEDLRHAGRVLRKKQQEHKIARQKLYAYIINARARGMTVSSIAQLSGLSRRMIAKILEADAIKEES